MTQDEIIEMAVKAGIAQAVAEVNIDIMEAFAKLIAEKEREACWEIACYYTQKFSSHTCLAIADEIRAIGYQKGQTD